jgi:hypothetical protein
LADGRSKVVGALLGGALLACLVDWACGDGCATAPHVTGWWAADREAASVERLDPALRPQQLVRTPSPLRIAALAAGGAWILCASSVPPLSSSAADPAAPRRSEHELRRIDDAGRGIESHRVGVPVDLCCADDGAALLLERGVGSTASLRCFPLTAAPTALASIPEAGCLAAATQRILVGTTDGRLVLLDAQGYLERERDWNGAILDLAAAAATREWWMLLRPASGASTRTELWRLDAALHARWQVPIELSARQLIPVPRREQVWLADAETARVLRVGADGRIELEPAAAPQRGISGGQGLADGGALFVTPGAILHVSSNGDWLAGQGGFDALVDLSALR